MEHGKQKNECCDSKGYIKGIVCNVVECAYHHNKSECCAGTICVGPVSAETSADTACATFKPRTV